MKLCCSIQIAFLFCAVSARSQGTFFYDQQSATNQGVRSGDGGAPIDADQPMGQSFTPSLSAVGFVQFKFEDFNRSNGLGATIYVNLRADSITGTILGSTAPVFLPDNSFSAVTNFFFSAQIPVAPGTPYYFQPVVQSGDSGWTIIANSAYVYPGGTAIFRGNPSANGTQLWFREGVVPEPSTPSLLIVGLAASACFFSGRRRRCAPV